MRQRTPPRGRVAVVGGSIAGLIAGLLLARQGWQVRIYERSGETLASRGAGISPHRELFDAFAQAGLDISGALGVRVDRRQVLGADGRVVASAPSSQLFTSWGLLYRALKRAFPAADYCNGQHVTAIAPRVDGAELEFEDGRRDVADWVIGADGVRSIVRRHVAPDTRIAYTGYVAWRGLAHEADVPPAAMRRLGGAMTFHLPPGEHILGYTVAGPNDTLAPGQRWYNWVWYRPARRGAEYEPLVTDADGTRHTDGIAPHLIRECVIAKMREDARALLPPAFQAVIAATAQPFIQPVVEVASTRMAMDQCVLIGDAAFTVRPHIGFGVSKAAADAATLAGAFAADAADMSQAIEAWRTERERVGHAVLARSAELGCYLGRAPDTLAEAIRHGRFRRSTVLLNEVAAPDPARYVKL